MDLRIAEEMLSRGWHGEVCFHSQQAAEKALKAVLAACNRIVRTHNLVRLAEAAGGLGLDTGDFDFRELRMLSDQYFAPRYPNFREERGMRVEDYTAEQAGQCLRLSKKILGRVQEWAKGRGIEV